MRFLALASGSKGNCAYISTPHSQVLIDCGISVKRLGNALGEHGVNFRGIDAVFITHTHSDHVSGLGRLLARLPVRVYCHELIVDALLAGITGPNGLRSAGNLDLVTFSGEAAIQHRDLEVTPVPVSHDCEPTVAFNILANGKRIGILTDLGATDDGLGTIFGDCDLLLLEANHCPRMLEQGPYPEALKKRIRGSKGHLSNQQAVEFATGLARMPGHLLLGHLSAQNNNPSAVRDAFTRVETGAIPHTVLAQHNSGPLTEL